MKTHRYSSHIALNVWWVILCQWCLILIAAGIAGVPLTAFARADFSFTQPQIENVGDAESIPDGIVTSLIQDTRGFIWIGTQNGLLRYDGYQFRKFLNVTSDPTSLSGNFVSSLLAGKDGRIWVGTNSDGLSVFDPVSERFAHFRHDPKQANSLAGNKIVALAEDAQGGLWIGTEQGLDHLPRAGKNLIQYRHDRSNPNSLLANIVQALMVDKHKRLWVGSASGLQRLKADGKSFELIVDRSSVGVGSETISITTLFEALDGKIWIGTARHGAAWLVPEMSSLILHWLPLNRTKSLVPAFTRETMLSYPQVNEIIQVQTDQIWLATNGGGINIVDANEGTVLQHLRRDPSSPNTLTVDTVKTLLMDRSGLLWIGTSGGGLQRFNSKNKMVRSLRHSQKQLSGLSHPDIHSVVELENRQLLFGSHGNGIDIFDRKQGLIGGWRNNAGLAGDLPDITVTTLKQTSDGTLWAGTLRAGALRMMAGSQEWQAVSGLPGRHVRKFFGRARW